MESFGLLAPEGQNAVVSPTSLLSVLITLRAISADDTLAEVEHAMFGAGTRWRPPHLDVPPVFQVRRAVFGPDAASNLRGPLDCAQVELHSLDAPTDVARWIAAGVGEDPTSQSAPVGPPVALAVAATVRFEAEWVVPFNSDRDYLMTFRGLDGTAVDVRSFSGERWADYASTEEVELVGLPLQLGERDPYHHRDARFTVLLALPRDGHNLAEIEQALDASSLESWLAALQTTELDLRLPRFRLDGASMREAALEALGVRSLGHPHLAIDLGGPPAVSSIGAASSLVVNERGVSLRDSVRVEIVVRGIAREVHFDHPFLVFVVDREDDAILAMGRVVDPS